MICRGNCLPNLLCQRHTGRSHFPTTSPLFQLTSLLPRQFPYATKALPGVLASKWDEPAFQPYRDAAPEEARKSPEAYRAAADKLTAANSKIAWLKNLQGYLWEDGYNTGAYSTPLFPDVAPRLKAWKKDGYALAIYSSGSVFAQKLLFAHVQTQQSQVEVEAGDVDETPASSTNKKRGRSDDEAEDLADGVAVPSKKRLVNDGEEGATGATTAGAADNDKDDVVGDATTATETEAPVGTTDDLTGLFQGWFDTTNAGPKTEEKSYEVIAEEMKVRMRFCVDGVWLLIFEQLKPQEILFFSDNVLEIEAAVKAEMQAVLVDRPGNAPVDESDAEKYRMVKSLDEVEL